MRFESALGSDIDWVRANYLISWAPELNCIYFETPKVGCSSIKGELQAALGLYQERGNIHNKKGSPLLSPKDDIGQFLERLKTPNDLKFTFVRNPYSRVLSAYMDKVLRDSPKSSRYRKELSLDESVAPSFLKFLQAVQRTPDKERDIHWMTQSRLTYFGVVAMDYVGRFENFEYDLTRLLKTIGVHRDGEEYRGRQHATDASSKLNKYYCNDSQKLVYQVYREDFENYSYSADFDLFGE